ncbi:hypothetical protein Scep_020183 [Stephania cephalantha]|uniref:Sialate O-acetylesterase domain-containing protein n=1 Tax=Stephania cephalantha TaxID=152367 RepID=A0AAP0IC68_9MAGN
MGPPRPAGVPTQPSVLRLSSRLTWEEARDPLHADIDVNKTCGVGPGLPFANAVRALDSTMGVVGLVPCAVGGTTIAEWARGGKLYDQMVRRAGAAVREGGGGVVRAVLWYQGESDTVSQADAESYRGNLETLFSDFRDDLNSPALPIIQACLIAFHVAIASGMGPLVGTVREAQMEVRVPMVWTVDAMGLHLEADGLHLTTDAQVQLGKMLAQAFVKTTLQSPSPVVRYSNAAPNHKPFYGGGWVFGHLLLSAFVGIWRQMSVS